MDHKIKDEAMNLRSALADHKTSVGIYMNYIVGIKTLKNSLLSSTIEDLKGRLKALGVPEEDIKKLKIKKDYIEALIELL